MTREHYQRLEKVCPICSTVFTPKGQNTKYCTLKCRKQFYKESGKLKAWYDDFNRKNGVAVGIGSGGHTKFGEENFAYKHGRSVFLRWAKERKESVGVCEHCGKDIKHATHYNWVGHHKDHNPKNNTIENLVLLCKRCHQIEHECWERFEGATTKVERDATTGRYKCIEAPAACSACDDIV